MSTGQGSPYFKDILKMLDTKEQVKTVTIYRGQSTGISSGAIPPFPSAGFGFDDKRKIGIEERINDPKNAAAHERWVEIQNRPGLSEYDKKRLPWDFGEYLRIYHPEVKGAPDNRAELEAEWINYLNYCGY